MNRARLRLTRGLLLAAVTSTALPADVQAAPFATRATATGTVDSLGDTAKHEATYTSSGFTLRETWTGVTAVCASQSFSGISLTISSRFRMAPARGTKTTTVAATASKDIRRCVSPLCGGVWVRTAGTVTGPVTLGYSFGATQPPGVRARSAATTKQVTVAGTATGTYGCAATTCTIDAKVTGKTARKALMGTITSSVKTDVPAVSSVFHNITWTYEPPS